MEKMTRIIPLTLSWNGLDKLKALRDGLFSNLSETGLSFEWFIRSNGCKDGTPEEVKTWSNTHLLQVDHNRDNFAMGVNSLADLAQKTYGDEEFKKSYLLLLNNDIVFKDDKSLKNMINLMTPDVGQVGARLMAPDSDVIHHAGVVICPRRGCMPWHYLEGTKLSEAAKKNRYFQAVTGAVALVRAEDFLKVGKLDPAYWWSFEDIDLSLKLLNLGKKIVCCGQAEISHEQSATLKKNPVNKLYMSNNVVLFKKRWSGKLTIDHDLYLKNPNFNLLKS